MKIKKIYLQAMALGLLVTSSSVYSASSLDNYVRNRMKFFDILPYENLEKINTEELKYKYELGRSLFMDTNLAGNRDINCMACHHPMIGTSDGLPLSRSVDKKNVLRRNSPGLFNIGDKHNTFMFWDGRVHYSPSKKVFTTPEPALNGDAPLAKEITSVMTSALAAQSIFPIITRDEMKGEVGTNEVADAADNLEAWEKVVKRVTVDSRHAKTYVEMFNKAFPKTREGEKINIGHFGESMATFMKYQFHSNGSPFHRYIAGDDSAMTTKQKNGFLVFVERGRCIACHQGNLLGLNSFFASVAVPSYGAAPFEMDLGRAEVTGEGWRTFAFKTPSLINVALTDPYMHNGAFRSIREVINHYTDIHSSLKNFDLSPQRRREFPVAMEVRNSDDDLSSLWATLQAPFLQNGLHFTEAEKDDLEEFLKEALTDPRYDTRARRQ